MTKKEMKKIASSAGISDTRIEIVDKFSQIEILLLDVLENESEFDFYVICNWLESKSKKLIKDIPKMKNFFTGDKDISEIVDFLTRD